MKVANKITQLIGNTPHLKVENYMKHHGAVGNIILKLESFNPLSSVKDRIGYAMLKDGIKRGVVKPDTTIIEPTSGNTGIALAFVCASMGYKLILAMPETMTLERRKLLAALGAELVLTEGPKGMKGAIAKAQELHEQTPNSVILSQFTNPANPQIHRDTTAQEIIRVLGNKVDALVSGIGTGGTITGVGEVLRRKNKNIHIAAVEPLDSPVLSGGKPGPHKIQGIGAGFVPEVLNVSVYNEIIQVTYEDAVLTARSVAKLEGVLVGVSSGAALWAATQLAKREEFNNKNIVVIMPDTAERYLSTILFDETSQITPPPAPTPAPEPQPQPDNDASNNTYTEPEPTHHDDTHNDNI